MRERKNRAVMIIMVLVLIVVVLVGIIAYGTLVKPTFTGYVVDKQVEALNGLVVQIQTQIQQTGSYQLTNADEQGNVIVCQSVQTQAPA